MDVRGEQVPQRLDVAVPDRVEEAGGQFVPFPPVGVEPGRPASMCRRARTASWRQAGSDRRTAAAMSGKPKPNTSRRTNTARSSGLSRSSSSSAAIDTESASSAERSGSW